MNDAGSLIENHEFVEDLCRYAEGIFTEAAVKKKYRFDDKTWARLGEDEARPKLLKPRKCDGYAMAAPHENGHSSILHPHPTSLVIS
jgi:hypothetical protein